MSPLSAEPCQDRADHNCRSIGDGELVVSRREPSPLLDIGKRTLDDITVPIRGGIERARPPTFATALLPGRDLVFLLRDHCADSTRPQVFAVAFGPISPISQNGVRARARTTATSPRDSNVSQDLRQNYPVVTLAAGDYHRQRPTLTVDGVVDLRRQPTARATDAVPGRLTLRIGQILVIRRSPLCLGQGVSCSLHAGEHG